MIQEIEFGIAIREIEFKNGSIDVRNMRMDDTNFGVVGFGPGPSIKRELKEDIKLCKRKLLLKRNWLFEHGPSDNRKSRFR